MIEMVRDGRFRVAGAILFALLAGALLLGWQHYREVSAQHSAAQKGTREQWLNQGKKNPHSAAHYGFYAFKPRMPLMMVDQGTNPYTGVAVWLEAHKQNEFKYRPAQDATAVERLGELTGASVLQLLIPLLIILLAFSTFSGERELGTLRQLLSLGVKRSDLARGKALGVAGALSLLLLPATVIGVIALTAASSRAEMLASVPRMAWMMLGYIIYFLIFIAISLTVSALAPSSRSALTILAGFWILNGLIAPRAASDIAKAVRPTPSAFEFSHKMELALKGFGHDSSEERTKRLEADLIRKYKVDRIEDLPVNFNGIRLQDGEEHGNQVFDKAYAELWNTFSEQGKVHLVLGAIAPSLAIRSASMGFAGADFPQHMHFASAAEEYRRTIQRTMNNDLVQNASNTGTYFAGDDLWRRVPPFEYTAPGVGWVLSRQISSLGTLAAWSIVAAAVALWACGKVRVY
jgi:ABC-2 type transport system permease protein